MPYKPLSFRPAALTFIGQRRDTQKLINTVIGIFQIIFRLFHQRFDIVRRITQRR
jgi:hypothetical protein